MLAVDTVGGAFDADLFECKLVIALDSIFIGIFFGILSGKLIDWLFDALDGELVDAADGKCETKIGDFRSASLARRGSVKRGSGMQWFSEIFPLASTLPISGLNATEQNRAKQRNLYK